MENALDNNGYEGQYMFQTFGTSELGGKLLAEGTDIEADHGDYEYLLSGERPGPEFACFQDLDFDVDTIDEFRGILRADHFPGRNDHCKYRDDGRK